MVSFTTENLNISWANPTPHEKLIYSTRVNEIFHGEFFLLVFISFSSIIILNLIFTISPLQIIILMAVAILLFGIFSPIFFRPWEIVLSNKRLILRNKYWNIGRFSKVISFNLSHLNSQQIAPRIKIIPLTTGIFILFSYSLQLIEFSFSGTISPPILVRIVFLFGGAFGIISNVEMELADFVFLIFSPFHRSALIIGLLSAIFAISLIIFGLPRGKSMQVSTTGGHSIHINTGLPKTLSDMLNSIGRKHRVKERDNWKWDIPLLEDEITRTRIQVGLIDRKTQVLGLISLLLSIESLGRLVAFVTKPSVAGAVLFSLTLISLIMTWFSISFSKKFRRLISSDHRLILQDEQKAISGIYGRRIYTYTDLPFDNVRGFSYANYSGIQSSAIVGLLIILFAGYSYALITSSLIVLVLTAIAFMIYFALNYKTFTSLAFHSLSGSSMLMSFHFPSFMISLSHKIEKRQTLFSRLFPNLFTEHQVAALCNDVRGVAQPILDLAEEDLHEITVEAFIDEDEVELGRWGKLAPFRYAKQSLILGGVLSSLIAIYITTLLPLNMKFPFVALAFIAITIVILRRFVYKRRSLIMLNNRIFHTEEISPRRVALLFGVLPEKRISELDLEHLNLTRFKLSWGGTLGKVLSDLVLVSSSILLIKYAANFGFEDLLLGTIQFIFGLILVVSLINLVVNVARNLPKYGLSLYTRYGEIVIDYMVDLENFMAKLSQARGEDK